MKQLVLSCTCFRTVFLVRFCHSIPFGASSCSSRFETFDDTRSAVPCLSLTEINSLGGFTKKKVLHERDARI